MYILSESMSHIFHFFCEMACDISLVSLDPYSIHHSIYFRCDYFSYFDVGWLSLTFLSLCFLLSLFCSFISPYLIWFLSFLVLLNVWLGFNLHTLFLLIWYVHSFIITFCVETLRSRIHDIFYALHLMHEGYGDYIIGIFEPSFLSFLSPYYLNLRYVPHLKTTLWSWLHTLCLMAHTWAILEICWRLFLGAWQMGSWGDGFTLGHTLFISDGFSEVIWSTLGHTPLIDGSFFWDDALHWGIVSFCLDHDGLGVVGWSYIGA